jgi:hypothetical protein
VEGRTDGRTGEEKEVRMDGRKDGRMKGERDGRVCGWTD